MGDGWKFRQCFFFFCCIRLRLRRRIKMSERGALVGWAYGKVQGGRSEEKTVPSWQPFNSRAF